MGGDKQTSHVILPHLPDRNQSAAKLWCFVAIDDEGNESPCGMSGPHGFTMMMASQWETVEQMRPLAARMAKAVPKLRIVLREYSEFIDPETL
ncbi:MAG: hypothetical protein KGL39_45485 [Patescibacteria group bacterium]|nr:hypothetical protein [Patescibacteria group bacterium]